MLRRYAPRQVLSTYHCNIFLCSVTFLPSNVFTFKKKVKKFTEINFTEGKKCKYVISTCSKHHVSCMVPQQSILKLKILAKFEAATQLQIYFEELNSIQMKTTAMNFKSFPDSRHTKEYKKTAVLCCDLQHHLWKQLR